MCHLSSNHSPCVITTQPLPFPAQCDQGLLCRSEWTANYQDKEPRDSCYSQMSGWKRFPGVVHVDESGTLTFLSKP
ncbi:hypothetical protein ASPCADRAFT_203683 [Aspergillus carbonarius ITEM 5010]|uniref:Uncharacterized protein n=1 Tax=Aspergillus carbonarius (strain ITEM 5010) TaxID=602072 RepID=A0A1R3RZE1_ASPC5|nr:hypothetical protein ASPCADRAFT_203683 [Aspergillus carbonarius ITEM 5010]